MRRIFWLIIFLLLFAVKVSAADLAATVRLNRSQSGVTPLPILVTVKAATVGTENNLKIVVGAGYTVDSLASNIFVDTAGLPTGVNVMPGIGTASQVSGKTITFPSGDLVVGTTYGFYITSGIGVNPNYLNRWTVETASGATIIDRIDVGVLGVANDRVVVTGKVGALASDFQLEISPDKTGFLNIGDEVTYTLKFGSYLLSPTHPLKISAEWSRGTVDGSPVPSLDIVDYVVGSGTTAIGGVAPVIDILNRKIEWTINSFPANTIGNIVSFRLKVNNSYTGYSKVSYDVTGYLNGANVVTTNKSVNSVYKPLAPTSTPLPTIVPTAGVTVEPTSSTSQTTVATLTPTPTVIPQIKISTVSVATLTDSGINILVNSSSQPQSVKIKYGLKANSLTRSITSINGVVSDLLKIDGLDPNLDYFFKVDVTSKDGLVVSSDIYTFRTAVRSEVPVIDPNSVVVSVANNIILDASEENDPINSVIMTPASSYAFRINLSKSEEIKSVRIYIRDSQVLGITTVYGAEPNSTMIDLSEIVNGGFVGHLVSPTKPGYYDISLRVEDIHGNIVESKVGQMRVIEALKVVDVNNVPIENAKIVIYKYNLKKNIYEKMAVDLFGIANPSFTETDGTLNVVFPKGKYRVEVSSIGYLTETKEFSVGIGREEKNPVVALTKTKMTLSNAWGYYNGAATDVFRFSYGFVANLIFSKRFFDFVAIFVNISLVIVVWLLLSSKLKIEWWMLPTKCLSLIKRKKDGFVRGVVIDEKTKIPVGGVKVFLIDSKNNKVLSTSMTDKIGEFSLKLMDAKSYKVMATKEGYESTAMFDYSREGLLANNLKIEIENQLTGGEILEKTVKSMLTRVVGFLFSIWLLVALILELGFSVHFGTLNVWRPMVISWLNLALWLSIKLHEKY